MGNCAVAVRLCPSNKTSRHCGLLLSQDRLLCLTRCGGGYDGQDGEGHAIADVTRLAIAVRGCHFRSAYDGGCDYLSI